MIIQYSNIQASNSDACRDSGERLRGADCLQLIAEPFLR